MHEAPALAAPPRPAGFRHGWLGAAAAVVVLALLTGASITVYQLNSANRDLTAAQKQDLALRRLGGGKNLTEIQLSGFDKRQLFFALYKRAMREQLVSVQGTIFSSPTPDMSNSEGYNVKFTIDYRTQTSFYAIKELARSRDDVVVGNRSMCVAGELYVFAEVEEQWKRDLTSSCVDATSYSYALGDGITPWGLTREQADSLMAYFEERNPRVLNVTALRLATIRGRRLLRFTVDITPTKTNLIYKGLIHLRQAFEHTGLDAESHPYLNRCGGFHGKHLVFYIDPRTGLLAASRMSNSSRLGQDGRPEKRTALTPYTSEWYEYSFGSRLPTLAEAVADR